MIQKQTVFLPVKLEEDKTSILSSLPKEEWGVHRTHCCKKHGCKYSDENCPVILGHVEQDYRCEENTFDDCFEPNFDLDKQEGYFFTPEQLNEYTANVIKQALETAAEKADITYTQETHPFSEEDVRWIFAKAVQLAPSTESHTRMISDEQYRNHVLDSLYSNVMKLWKEQQPKIIYYE